MKVIHLNCYESFGGAARAASRIHKSLVEIGADSFLRVAVKSSDDFRTLGPDSKVGKAIGLMRPTLGQQIMRCHHTNNPILHSAALIPSGLHRELNRCDADVVNLHWVAGEMISVAEIGRITKPVVWTLHDMWAFCGAEHYVSDQEHARFIESYRHNNRSPEETGCDINRWVWKRKLRNWKRPMTIVAPSRWLAECAKRSVLFSDWRVEVIPNTIDTTHWRPLPRAVARDWLGLPPDGDIVLFGAMENWRNQPIKGGDLMFQAIEQLKKAGMRGLRLVVFGQSEPKMPIDFGFPVHYLGHLHDDLTLVAMYSAADVMVVPSRQEAFGQTASEAHACAVPVVAFRTSGLKDIVDHEGTGYLADPFDIVDLARGISWVLDSKSRWSSLSINARKKAEACFSYPVVARQYCNLYEDTLRCGPRKL